MPRPPSGQCGVCGDTLRADGSCGFCERYDNCVGMSVGDRVCAMLGVE